MKADDLQNLIAEGEGERLEFKAGHTTPELVAKTVCAFLNKSGGTLLLGIGAKGQILGIPSADSDARRLKSELPKLISPPALWTVERVRVGTNDVLFVEVPEGQDKPYVAGGAIFFRRGASDVPAKRDEIGRLIESRVEASQRWERQLAIGTDAKDLNDRVILETMRLAIKAQRWQGAVDDISGFLHSMGLTARGGITNAAVLLYGKAPSRMLPQARVRLLVLPEGKTGDRYLVDKLFEKCLLLTAKELQEALAVQVGGVASQFSRSWQRTDRPIYPVMALREGVMNSLVHRDYTLGGSVTISVQPESLRISNPGGLPAELTPADLKQNHPSLPRNPDVAHVCFLHGLIEKIGRGTQRIVEECQRAQLREPKWQSSSLETTLTLFSPLMRARAETDELNERQHRILAELRIRGQLRPTDVAKLVGRGVTGRTVRSDLQGLLQRGQLLRRGRGRSISYVRPKKSGAR
jgi:ATP-dependent DNA helicase RecG